MWVPKAPSMRIIRPADANKTNSSLPLKSITANVNLKIPVRVMIRNIHGTFIYKKNDLKMMVEQIEYCKSIGVDGVVFGCLKENHQLDMSKINFLTKISKPLNSQLDRKYKNIKINSNYIDEIKEIIIENNIKGIIIGNPINMDGSFGASAQSAKDFANFISNNISIPVSMWDERLSSEGAFNLSSNLDINVSKKVDKLDQNAASFILQGAIDYLRR